MQKEEKIKASYKFLKSYSSLALRSPSRSASLHFGTSQQPSFTSLFYEISKMPVQPRNQQMK
tara:strand:+ start:959 stop:1144 length:186 start_codon:yes stop_codon:yes gene_type:complete